MVKSYSTEPSTPSGTSPLTGIGSLTNGRVETKSSVKVYALTSPVSGFGSASPSSAQ